MQCSQQPTECLGLMNEISVSRLDFSLQEAIKERNKSPGKPTKITLNVQRKKIARN